jgi:hypothetical protein
MIAKTEKLAPQLDEAIVSANEFASNINSRDYGKHNPV